MRALTVLFAVIAFRASAQDEIAPVSDDAVYEACMVRAEAVDYPDGLGPDIMAPNCMCVATMSADPAVRRNLVETAAIEDPSERAAATYPATSAALAACFEVSVD